MRYGHGFRAKMDSARQGDRSQKSKRWRAASRSSMARRESAIEAGIVQGNGQSGSLRQNLVYSLRQRPLTFVGEQGPVNGTANGTNTDIGSSK